VEWDWSAGECPSLGTCIGAGPQISIKVKRLPTGPSTFAPSSQDQMATSSPRASTPQPKRKRNNRSKSHRWIDDYDPTCGVPDAFLPPGYWNECNGHLGQKSSRFCACASETRFLRACDIYTASSPPGPFLVILARGNSVLFSLVEMLTLREMCAKSSSFASHIKKLRIR
jgi:hypothetical protein